MSDAARRQAGQRLAQALAPACHRLDRDRRSLAGRAAALGGVQMLPRVALGLALGFAGAAWIEGGPPFDPWLLPAILPLWPLAAAAAQWLRAATLRSHPYEAALACDRAADNKDRWSAAVEFAAEPGHGDGRTAALRTVAIEDGLARLDALRPELARETAVLGGRPRALAAGALLALAIVLLPGLLLSGWGAGGSPSVPQVASGPTTGGNGAPETPANAPDSRTDGPAPPTAAPGPPPPAERPAEEPPDEAPPNGRPAAGARTETGAGTGSQAGRKRGGQNAGASGAPRSTAAGRSSRSGAGGGGQGAAQSQSAAEPQPSQSRPPRSSRPAGRVGETRPGEQEPSANTPSGPSRGGGRMTAVGNQRAGMERGSERDEDPDVEDEEVEDEQEESEQRGGVMPMTRDRQSPASRELGISGDGPPNDGRGGPTPPKKSRGTASLVLGIRLPDQVRGQPNPGTAKTSIEQVPPQTQTGAPYAAAPAAPAPASRVVHSRVRDPGALADALRRYYELLTAPR